MRSPNSTPDSYRRIFSETVKGSWYGEVLNRRKDGTEFSVDLWTSVVRNDHGEPVAMVGVARDITERKRAEERVRDSLREKEVLLKEIHHRVKNNMQVISSLLNLQSEYTKDEHISRVLRESQNRVKSMALIHEKLYQSRNLAVIDFGEYVRELSTQIFRSYGMTLNKVSLQVDVESVALGVDRAIPCGIIVNELVSNALKYAFPNGNFGRVTLGLRELPSGRVELQIGDNGVGIPEIVDVKTAETLGLSLVRMLTEQIQGTLSTRRGVRTRRPGTRSDLHIDLCQMNFDGTTKDSFWVSVESSMQRLRAAIRKEMDRTTAGELVGAVGLAATYVLTARLGLTLSTYPDSVTLVWPPSGIALAAVLLFGYRVWPGIALGALVAIASTGAPLILILAAALGSTGEAIFGAYLLRSIVDFDSSFRTGA